MGSVTGLIGLGGGAAGSGFSGPQGANIVSPTNSSQVSNSFLNNQAALNNQNTLLQALQSQNGIQNQSNVYNQMQGVANGTGPNPAQAMLNQTTGQNVANQAALMAGQRGAGANAGLIARQAAQQGAATQQQAAGQGATLQSQQSLNALGQMGGMASGMANNQIGQTNANQAATQAQQNSIYNAQLGVGNQGVSSQGNVNSNNATLAGTQMQGQQGLIGGMMNMAGSMMSMADGGEVDPGSVQTTPGAQLGTNTGAATMANAGKSSGGGGSIMSMLPMLAAMAAEGGRVEMADGGSLSAFGPQSMFGQYLNGNTGISSGSITAAPGASLGTNTGAASMTQGGESLGQGMKSSGFTDQLKGAMSAGYAKGGKVPALVSPGEVYLPPTKAKEVVNKDKDPIKEGQKVPGKPKYPGNDYRNDIVPTTLESGGVIIPNKILQGPNPHWESMKFVRDHLESGKK